MFHQAAYRRSHGALIEDASQKAKAAALAGDDDFQLYPPAVMEQGEDETIPYPKIGFGRDWPVGLADNATLFAQSASTNMQITFDKSLRGTAFRSLQYNSGAGLIGYLLNVPNDHPQQHGGADMQTALFLKGIDPYFSFEFNNPLEAHGFWDLGVSPVIQGAVPKSLLGRVTAPNGEHRVHILTQMQYWLSPVYKNPANPQDRGGAILPGGKNDFLSGISMSKVYSLGNVGTDRKPLINDQVMSCDIVLSNAWTEAVTTDILMTAYHYFNPFERFYDYDPRTATRTLVYPFDNNGTQVATVATANGAIASAFAAGQVSNGRTLVVGDKILLTAQNNASENGYWIVTAGALTTQTFTPSQAQVVNLTGTTSTLAGTLWQNTTGTTWVRVPNYTTLPQTVASLSGDRAMAVWCPQIPLRGEGSSPSDPLGVGIGLYARSKLPTAHGGVEWSAGLRIPSIGPQPQRYKVWIVVGQLNAVETQLVWLWNNLEKVLKPAVFDWTFYRDTTLKAPWLTEDQVRLHWLCRGADAGLIGKSGFIYNKASGQSNFNYLLNF
ncbi:MAG: hypothetical protein ACREMA_07740 [Longimicrobiales bacterium]